MRKQLNKRAGSLSCRLRSRRWWSAAVVAALLLGGVLSAGPAAGQPRSGEAPAPVAVFAHPSGYWLSPPTYSGRLYGATSPQANWNIAQWGIPNGLPSFYDGVSLNRSAGVLTLPHGVVLQQTTSRLSCGTTVPPEFDLLAEPNTSPTYPGYPSAALDVSHLANLAALSDLSFGIALRPLAMHVLGAGCQAPATAGIDQGVMLGAVILSDPSAGQTLFYQVQFDVYRVQNGVTTTTAPSYFYFTGSGGIYGYDDDATVYGQRQAQLGQSTPYHLALLPRLKQVIQQGQSYGMDQDLAHWYINGAYYGNSAWGHMVTAAVWQHFSLTVSSAR